MGVLILRNVCFKHQFGPLLHVAAVKMGRTNMSSLLQKQYTSRGLWNLHELGEACSVQGNVISMNLTNLAGFSTTFLSKISPHHLMSELEGEVRRTLQSQSPFLLLFSDTDESHEKISNIFTSVRFRTCFLQSEARNSCSHKLPSFNHLIYKRDRTSAFSSDVSKVESPETDLK